MSETIFSKIVNKEIPADIVYENEKILGFKDLHPQAKAHFLFIHKSATTDIADLVENNIDHLADIFKGIVDFANSEQTLKDGYRLVTNKGRIAGQSVFHTHIHVIGGEPLGHFGS